MATDLNPNPTRYRGKVVLTLVGTLVAGLALASAVPLVVAAKATGATANRLAVPKLQGTVGPGFTISLKRGLAKARLLKAGQYTFVVSDKSSIHNFTLNGQGVTNRTITPTGFVGTKAATLRLRTGMYRFYCTVHPSITGSFRVT
jgi:hypothetical protein